MNPHSSNPFDDPVAREAERYLQLEREAREFVRLEREANQAREIASLERAKRDAADMERISAEDRITREASVIEEARRAAAFEQQLAHTYPGDNGVDGSYSMPSFADLANMPASQIMRDWHTSPAYQMPLDAAVSPSALLSGSVAHSIAASTAMQHLTRDVLGMRPDGTVTIKAMSGISALRDWGTSSITETLLEQRAGIASVSFRDAGIVQRLITERADSFAALADASRHVVQQAHDGGWYATLPSYLVLAPTLETYASASLFDLAISGATGAPSEIHIIDSLAEELLDGVSEEFEARLASLNQTLIAPVRGAWQTAVSDCADRVRQAAVSVRHAIETMIDALAPKDAAAAWAKSNSISKKPPKAARDLRSAARWSVSLRYIMRHVDSVASNGNDDSLYGYLAETDLVDMLILIEQLNQSVHEPDTHIQEHELTAVLRRAMAFMTLLLDAYEFEPPRSEP